MITMRSDVAMLPTPITKHVQSQKGSLLVEFALILPVFLLLLFGVINVSLALYDKTVLAIATREGARAGVKFVANRTDAIIASSARTATLQVCQNNLISLGGGLTPNVTTVIQNNILTVSANFNYTGFYVFSNLFISAQTSMKLE